MVGIHLRELQEKDAPYMLEWMLDPSISCFFRFDVRDMTEDSCRQFIVESGKSTRCWHYAIADESDEYLGTVSLKNINYEKGEAEYAISTRKRAHGTGAALEATRQIWKIAFLKLNLKRIYLNVLDENQRANAFYQKAGYCFKCSEENAVEIRGEKKTLNWYEIDRKHFMEIENG